MGYVYSARGKGGEPVALKVLHPELLTNNVAVTRFMTEAETIFKLRHPNIVEVFDYGRGADRTLFIAMEVLTGSTVVDEIQTRGTIPPDEARQIVLETSRALAAAHAAGVVHRDLKPENLMLVPRPDGSRTVKVLDFGLAIVMEENRMEMHRKRVTQQDVVMGTPGYMSPEQIHGFDVDARADLYALGVIWWEMLTGRQLFSGRSSVEIMMRHIEERPPHPQKVHPQAVITQPEAQLLAALLEKNKDDRPADGGAVLGHLANLLQASTPPPFTAAPPTPAATPVTGEMEIDLGPTGLELAVTDGPSLDLDGRVVSGRHQRYGAVPQRTHDELWTVEHPDGKRDEGLSKDELIQRARDGQITHRHKVGIAGRAMIPAQAMSFLGVRPPDVLSKAPEAARVVEGSSRARRGPWIWAAVLLGVGAGAGYVVTEQPAWFADLASRVRGDNPADAAPPLTRFFDDQTVEAWREGVKGLPNLGEGVEASRREDFSMQVARGRHEDRRGVDRALQKLMLAGAAEPETLALYVRNRAALPDARAALSQEHIPDVVRRARKVFAQDAHLRLAEAVVARRFFQSGIGPQELVRMGESFRDPDELRLVAEALLDYDRDAAARVAARARELWPNSPALLRAEAALALRAGDLPKARAAAERRLAIEPFDAYALKVQAKLAVLAQAPEAAYDTLARHLSGAPYDTGLRLLAVQIAVHDLADLKKAAALVRDRSTVGQEPPLLTAYRAAVEHASSSVEQGEATLAALKARRTRFAVAHLLDADFALSAEDEKAAHIAAQNALDAGADAEFPALARTLLGEAMLDGGKPAAAREAFARAHNHDPERLDALLGLLLSAEPDDPALLDALLDRDPLAFVDRSASYEMPPVGTRGRFRTRFKAASGLTRDWGWSLIDLERADVDKADKARSRLMRSLAKHKKNPALRVYYAAALVRTEQPDKALEVLDAMTSRQDALAALAVRARALFAAGAPASDIRMALDELEAALVRLPTSDRTERLQAKAETLRAALAEREGAVDAARVRYQSAYLRDRQLRPAGAGLARLSS